MVDEEDEEEVEEEVEEVLVSDALGRLEELVVVWFFRFDIVGQIPIYIKEYPICVLLVVFNNSFSQDLIVQLQRLIWYKAMKQTSLNESVSSSSWYRQLDMI